MEKLEKKSSKRGGQSKKYTIKIFPLRGGKIKGGALHTCHTEAGHRQTIGGSKNMSPLSNWKHRESNVYGLII